MATQTSMLHVRVNDQIKTEATEKLKNLGFTLSDAVRILLTRIAKDEGFPLNLIVDNAGYNAWFKAKVYEALNDTSLAVPHEQVMNGIQELIERKRVHVES